MRRYRINPDDFIGTKVHRLTIVDVRKEDSDKQWWAECRCVCGGVRYSRLHSILRADVKSCGCLVRELCHRNGAKSMVHGMKGTRLYRTWINMRYRCRNPNCVEYKDYGGRGIGIDPRWDSFSFFAEDMGHPPSGLQLDRIDNDGPYSPSNCRWATRTQQSGNRRSNRKIELNGEILNITDWAHRGGISLSALRARLMYGW